MPDVATLHRRKRRLRAQQRKENKAFSRFKRSAKYGSKEHRKRISQGVLEMLYGRPFRGKYQKKARIKMRRKAGYNPPMKAAVNNYQFRRTNKKRARTFK